MIGEIKMFPYTRTPEGHIPCDGRELEADRYPALFTLIGNEFGGDGSSHFCVPKILNEQPGLYFFIHAYDDDFPTFE
jgi:microcystin-dependent protein